MRQTPVIAATAALLLLTLTGCTGTSETAPSATQSGDVKVEVQRQGTPTVEPLVAETPAVQTLPTDAQFLKDVRKALTNGRQTQIPNASDEQLLKAGHDACAAVAAGTPEAEITVIEGEKIDSDWGGYHDSNIILTIARKYSFC